jgi:ribosomal RNA-processing protein 7
LLVSGSDDLALLIRVPSSCGAARFAILLVTPSRWEKQERKTDKDSVTNVGRNESLHNHIPIPFTFTFTVLMPPKSSAGTISGFTPLPVLYDHDTRHVLYIRAHVSAPSGTSRKKEWPEGRTMFIVNVPPDATEREMAQLFKSCGTVEKVSFDVDGPSKDSEAEDTTDDEDSDSESDAAPKQSKSITSRPTTDQRNQRPKVTPLPVIPLRSLRRTGHTAHILFLDASSCTRALALAGPGSKPIPWPTNGDSECPRGLAHYITRYEAARPSLDAVRTHADSAIAQFDFDLAASKAALRRESKYKKGEAIVDKDGFTLVVRGGAYGQAVGGGVGVASRKFMDGKRSEGRRKRHKEGKEKSAFYAFQIHEKKRNGAYFATIYVIFPSTHLR